MQLQRVKQIIVLTSILSLLILLQSAGFADNGADIIEYVGSTQSIQIYINPIPNKQYTPPPDSFYQYQALGLEETTATDIQVTYIGSWSNEAKNAFEYAASIWESQIDSDVPIQVEAEFESLAPPQLGGAGPYAYYINVPNEPVGNTAYPVALANALAKVDLNNNQPEISATFNIDSDWYFGTDGNTPITKIDFVSVILHEIGHGLGFIDSMSLTGGIGSWGSGSIPIIYDRFLENGSSTSLINGFPNGSAALATQLTSNNLYFNGPFANSANGGRVRIYAPNPWDEGSSIAHLNYDTYIDTPNASMTPSISPGEARHNPGVVTLGIFRDMGWLSSNVAPVLSQLPTVLIQIGSNKDNAIDLWQYVADDISSDSDLTYEIVTQSDPDAGATIDNNRYIDVNPIPLDWEGSSTITIKVTDPDNLSTQTSFTVISGDIQTVFLPIIAR